MGRIPKVWVRRGLRVEGSGRPGRRSWSGAGEAELERSVEQLEAKEAQLEGCAAAQSAS